MNSLLLTRPEPSCFETKAQLEAVGFEVVMSPALEIHYLNTPVAKLPKTAFLSTSQHAIIGFSKLYQERDIPLYVVGEASASVAKEAGWKEIRSVGHNVTDLKEKITQDLIPEGSDLLYIRGEEVSQPLTEPLRAKGYHVEEAMLYKALPSKKISEEARQALQKSQISAALFFSKRSLRIMQALMENTDTKKIDACCFSAAIASEADQHLWQSIHACSTPKMEVLLDMLKRLYHPENHTTDNKSESMSNMRP